MSLASVLSGGTPAGVYRWHGSFEPEVVGESVLLADQRFAYVDGRAVSTKAGALAALGEALGFPSWWGRNLDALEDCLRDVPGPSVLLWDGWGAFAESDPRTFAVVVELLAAHPSLTSLLRGAGPDVELPSLD